MTYRTATDKIRALYIMAGIAVLAIIALCITGNEMNACQAVQSFNTCAYALR